MSDELSSLPDLPRKRRKREADVTPRVLAWFKRHHNGPCAIEVKATDTNSIPESAVLPHQRLALQDASGAGIAFKIPDTKRRLPFDGFLLKGTPAYVVACFTKDKFCLVYTIEHWNGARASKIDTTKIVI